MKVRRIAIVALVVAVGLGLSGCMGFPGPFPGVPAAGDGSHHGNGNGHGNGQDKDKDHGKGSESGNPGGAGAAGMVVSVAGSTAQVRNAQRMTAVTWNDATRFTTESTASSGDLKTGECVAVRRSHPASDDTSGSTPTPGPRGVAAASITMFPAVNGSCAGPLDATGKANANGMLRGGGAVGVVTSVSDGSIVVSRTRGNATREVAVTYDSSTQFGSLHAGSAADVVSGACIVAKGKRAAGTLTATAIAVSPGMSGSCNAPMVKPGPMHPTPDRTADQ